MKRKSLLLIIPFAAVGLAGCGQNKPDPNPPAQQCDTATFSIKTEGVKSVLTFGETLQLVGESNLVGCTATWSSSASDIVDVDDNGLVTAGEKEGTATIYYGGESGGKITFIVSAKEIKEYKPEDVIAMCDEAGSGVVVDEELIVVGVVASGSTHDDNGWNGQFEGSNLKFSSARTTEDYGSSIDGCTVKIQGYAELYNGSYKIGYLPAASSPTKEKYNPTLISVTRPQGKDVIEVLGVASSPREIEQGATLDPSRVQLNVKLEDGTEDVKPATRVDLVTSAIGDAVQGTAYYNEVGSATFTIKVVAPAQSSMREAYEAAEKLTSGETAEFTFEGVVVATRTGSNEYYIQDGAYGIDIYSPSDKSALVVGKKVSVTSTLQNFKGLIETKTIKSITSAGDGTMPSAAVVESSDDLTSLKTNILAEADVVVPAAPTYSEASDLTLKVKVGNDEINLFFKKAIIPTYKSVIESLYDGAEISIKKAIVGCYNTKQLMVVDGTEIVVGEPTPEKEVSSIAISGEATKTSYHVGDSYSAAGLSVIATYTDGTSGTVSAAITPNKATAEDGDTSVTFSATFGGKTATKVVNVTVSPVEPSSMKDAYEAAEKLTSGETEEFTFEGVVVATRTGSNEYYIQDGAYGVDIYNPSDKSALVVGKKISITTTLQNFKGLIETKTIKSITSAGDGVMPSAAVVSSSADLTSLKTNILAEADAVVPTAPTYSEAADLTLKVKVGNDEVNLFFKKAILPTYKSFIESLYDGAEISIKKAIVGCYNTKQLMVVDGTEIVVGEPTPEKEVSSIAISGEASKTEYYIGDTYSAAGLSVVATYTDGTSGTVSAAITPNKATAEDGDTSVTFSATFGGKTATKVVNVSVTEKPTPVDPVTGKTFVKVTSQADLTEGTYILGSSGYFFHGVDEADKSIVATETDNTVVGLTGMAALEIAEVTGGYSIKILNGANEGKYIGSKTGNDKSIAFTDVPATHTITFENGVPTLGCGDKFLKFNDQSGQNRFRYYASGQKDVALYKLGAPVEPAVLTEITVSENHRSFYLGDPFVKETVTASYDKGDAADVTDKAVFSEVNMNQSGEQTVNVSYTEGGVTKNTFYTINISSAPAPHVDVTGVSLDKSTLTLDEGGSATLVATVAPSDASEKGVTWSSNDEDVATVVNGVVTAVKNGTATITVTTTDGGKTAICVVTVNEAPAPVEDVVETLTAESLGLGAGYGDFSKVQSSGILFQGNGTISSTEGIQIKDTASGSGIYSRTSGRLVKSVKVEFDNANGKTISVYGKAEGYTSIEASPSGTLIGTLTADGTVNAPSGVKNIFISSTGATYIKNIVVTYVGGNVSSVVSGVSLNKSTADLGAGDTLNLSAVVDGFGCSQNVTWETSDSGKATVANGVVTGVASGTVTITVKSADDNTKSAQCVITVTAEKTLMCADFTTKSASNTNYAATWTYDDFSLTGAANNNGAWDYIKLGIKSKEQTATICSTVGATAEITKIVVDFPKGSFAKTGQSCSEWGVYVYSDAEMKNEIDHVVSSDAIVNAASTFTLTPTSGKHWSKGCYFKVYFNTKDTGGNNGVVWVSKVSFIG